MQGVSIGLVTLTEWALELDQPRELVLRIDGEWSGWRAVEGPGQWVRLGTPDAEGFWTRQQVDRVEQ
jgi:hypothetical protein